MPGNYLKAIFLFLKTKTQVRKNKKDGGGLLHCCGITVNMIGQRTTEGIGGGGVKAVNETTFCKSRNITHLIPWLGQQ